MVFSNQLNDERIRNKLSPVYFRWTNQRVVCNSVDNMFR